MILLKCFPFIYVEERSVVPEIESGARKRCDLSTSLKPRREGEMQKLGRKGVKIPLSRLRWKVPN